MERKNMKKEKRIENLKPFEKGKVSRDQAVEAGRKGGLASVEAKKKKKKLRELCEIFGELPIYSDKAKKLMEEMGISPEDMTNKMAAVVGVFKKAAAGDVQAFNAIRDILGEKPKDEVESKVATSVTVNYVKSGAKFANSEDEVNDERK
ncbi:hypothetical protein SAMN05444350_11280 [Bacteroides stercorirosoris]|uniref:Uncharacterized protein n=2 Tax=Bacteroides stercorirosoris TaxID=871324 RepID=A0A1M6FKB2_9BACE|nr:hypothetical protein SAMN05444350_11280 [Bacteroides stercorirosoris]